MHKIYTRHTFDTLDRSITIIVLTIYPIPIAGFQRTVDTFGMVIYTDSQKTSRRVTNLL